MAADRGKLEKELMLLSESYDQEVITRGEFEKSKSRIEKELSDLDKKEEITVKEIPREKLEEKEDEKISADESEEDSVKTPISQGQESPKDHESKLVQKKPDEKAPEKESEKKEIQKEEYQKKDKHEKKPEEEPKTRIKKRKILLWSIIILIFISIPLIYFKSGSVSEPMNEIIQQETPACQKDSDCRAEGKFGFCINPPGEKARCEFKDDISLTLVVINDKACMACSTELTLKFMKEIFPGIAPKEIDISSEEGKALSKKLGIKALPAYIFDSNVSNAVNYNRFKQALIEKDGFYLVSNSVSGASYSKEHKYVKNN